jgi:hypothetical protein
VLEGEHRESVLQKLIKIVKNSFSAEYITNL